MEGSTELFGWNREWLAPDCHASVPSVTIALIAHVINRWPKSGGSKLLPVKESISR